MNYRKKEYDEIFLKGLTNAYEEKLISKNEDFLKYIKDRNDIENFYVMLLSIHSEWLKEVYDSMQLVYDAVDLDKCTGVDLDNLGELVGVPRVKPTKAYTQITFTANKSVGDDTVLPRTKVASDKGVVYLTSTELYFSEGSKSVTVPAYAVNAGVYSKVMAGELVNIQTKHNQGLSLKCVNELASSGGEDGQSDDEYREYLKNWVKIRQRGNAWAFKYFFRNHDGLDSYSLIPLWDGSGTIKVVIDTSDSDSIQSMRSVIYNELQENIVLYDDDLQVVPAEKKHIKVYCTVDVDIDRLNPYSSVEKEDIKSKIFSAIKTFINGGYRVNGEYYKGLVIGEDFIPYKLGVFIDAEVSEVKDVVFNEPLNPVVVSDEEIGVCEDVVIEMK